MARFLITSGPTREAIDPVRYISNRSSGRMGHAIAQALLDAGHEVELVSGPVALEAPCGARSTSVESAREMLAAAQALWPDCDGLIAVAAVADYRPATPSKGKLKRDPEAPMQLELLPNPDIVATLAAEKGDRLVVGFALESDPKPAEALRKLQAKNLDFVVLNDISAQGAVETRLTVLGKDGPVAQLGPGSKCELARELLSAVGIAAASA